MCDIHQTGLSIEKYRSHVNIEGGARASYYYRRSRGTLRRAKIRLNLKLVRDTRRHNGWVTMTRKDHCVVFMLASVVVAR